MEKPTFIDNRKKKRPEYLTLLCILTFIYSGMQALSNIVIYSNKDYIIKSLDESSFKLEDIQPLLDMPSDFFLLSFLFYSISLAGALFMWNLKKLGFHIYSLAQIALLFTISIYNPFNTTPIADILITSLFIFLYYRHLKFMTS